MKITYSKELPVIRRLRGKILFPYDIQITEIPDEEGNASVEYSYVLLCVEDRGQDITNYDDFKANNYSLLRAELYAPLKEQMDMQYHGVWEAHIEEVKAAFPKPE